MKSDENIIYFEELAFPLADLQNKLIAKVQHYTRDY